MFYYYGRKKKLAKFYPQPKYDTLIEPFAGSAAYSLHGDNWQKNVILIEKDERIYKIWKWFIEEATEQDILNLPDLKEGDYTSDFLQILHMVTKGAFVRKKVKVTKIMERNWRINKPAMAKNLYKVKHWQIINGDYSDAPDVEATWFIDPPYFSDAGMGYNHNCKDINYGDFTDFILSRKGEVICCDCEEADYLPFESLVELSAVAGKKSKEMIFYQDNPNIPVDTGNRCAKSNS